MAKSLMIAAAVAVAACAVLAAGPAQAAAPVAGNHVVVVSGSDGYLVYEVARSSKDIQAGNRNGGTLYSRDARGRVSTLADFKDAVGVITQTGHSLVQRTFTDVTVDGVTSGVEQVRHRDLATGRESFITLDPFDSLGSVAPDGYLVRHDSGDGDGGSYAGTTSLTYRHTDGSTSEVAVPFADGTDYRLQASDAGLLAGTPNSDEQTRFSRLAYMTWADPGVWHQIYKPGRLLDISCATPSSTHVACRIDGLDSAGPGLVLFRLRDGRATWLNRTHPGTCAFVDWATKGASLYALEISDRGDCTKGELYRLQDDGRLVDGSTRYRYSALGGITTAYRKAVLSGGDQAHLYATTGVTRKPAAIVTG